MTIRTHTFNGRRYKIDLEGPINGLTDTYKINDRHLSVYADLNTRNGLITAIHEALHAERWSEAEEVIERVSMEIGTFLWRMGFRKVNNE